MTKEIPLTQGQVALVDDEDYERLNQWKWCASRQKNGNYYALRTEGKWPFQKVIMMHRFIMNPPQSMIVDHQDKNGLNNQKGNLRIGNRSQNMANSKRTKGSASGYKGVTKSGKKWVARIFIYLSTWDTAEEAAKAYDAAAKKYFGEFAETNF